MEGSHKRSLEGQEELYFKRPRTDDSVAQPSKVLHVRNVEPNISQPELHAFVSQFGQVVSICFLSKFSQALIEMDSVQAATSVIMYTKQTPVFVGGKEAHFAFSKSQSINNSTRAGASGGVDTPPGGVHNILLCTILNPSIFDITVDVIYAIMSPYGQVNRIVVFNKNNTPQVLVEFENAMLAAQAKQALEGKDIYAGACTLKIEFSKSTKLNVHTNTTKQRDYSNPALPTQAAPAPAAPGGYPPAAYSMDDYYRMYGAAIPPVVEQQPTRSVLIVYGFDPNYMTQDRIFNLFCLYGNVSKIKQLNGNKGTLVQMSENSGADYAIQNLNGLTIFNQQLSIQYSKHPYIADSRHETTADGVPASPASRDFSSSPLNRFTRNPNAYKHIYKPSQTLYFGNAPKDFNEESFHQLFTRLGAPLPSQTKFFNLPPNEAVRDNEKKIGLMEFPTIQSAAEALILTNNEKIEGHTLKLAFSANSIHGGNANMQQQQQQQQPPQQQLLPQPGQAAYGGYGGAM